MIRREHSARVPLAGSGTAGSPEQAGQPQQVARLRHVGKAYQTGGQRQPVLRDFSLDIAAGEFVVVLGPSGCGKTTLLNLLGGLDRADSGSIHVCGRDLAAAGPAELTAFRARCVGFVFQFYNLLPTLTALENVEAGVDIAGIGRDQAAVMLDQVGLAAAAKKFPAQLSGGEQQRVAIARALAKSPRLVLADEPTGNIDQERAAEILTLMRGLNEQIAATFVVVTHNPAVAAVGTRVVRLGDGHVVADGPP
jgi:putative ABC transport system ATP-binding protein